MPVYPGAFPYLGCTPLALPHAELWSEPQGAARRAFAGPHRIVAVTRLPDGAELSMLVRSPDAPSTLLLTSSCPMAHGCATPNV